MACDGLFHIHVGKTIINHPIIRNGSYHRLWIFMMIYGDLGDGLLWFIIVVPTLYRMCCSTLVAIAPGLFEGPTGDDGGRTGRSHCTLAEKNGVLPGSTIEKS